MKKLRAVKQVNVVENSWWMSIEEPVKGFDITEEIKTDQESGYASERRNWDGSKRA